MWFEKALRFEKDYKFESFAIWKASRMNHFVVWKSFKIWKLFEKLWLNLNFEFWMTIDFKIDEKSECDLKKNLKSY